MHGGWKYFYLSVDPSMSAQAGVGILTSPQLSHRVFDWISLKSPACMLKLKAKDRILCVLQVYARNTAIKFQAFVDDINNALPIVVSTKSIIFLEDFNAYIGTDGESRKDVIGRHGNPVFNENGQYLLRHCCSNGLCIMNTFHQN